MTRWRRRCGEATDGVPPAAPAHLVVPERREDKVRLDEDRPEGQEARNDGDKLTGAGAGQTESPPRPAQPRGSCILTQPLAYHGRAGIGRGTWLMRVGTLGLELTRRPAIVPATTSGSDTNAQSSSTLKSVDSVTTFDVP